MRRRLDFYETAPWQVDALVDHLSELQGTIWCPCVGDGSLKRRLAERIPDLRFITNDLDPDRPADFHGDATDAGHWDRMVREQGRPDWVVENFPFGAAFAMIRHAYFVARLGVVAMARVSFAEPTRARGQWMAAHPYDKRITLERYSFTNNGKSDSTTTDWLVWAKVPLRRPFGVSAYGYKHLISDAEEAQNAQ